MKVYLAARYSRREELCGVRSLIEQMGHSVTSRWLNGGHQIDDQGAPLTEEREKQFEDGDPRANALRVHFAQEDFIDVNTAEVLIAFTELPRVSASRGGRHVELGLALAWSKTVIVCGPRENVFCWLPDVIHVESAVDALGELDRIASVSEVS